MRSCGKQWYALLRSINTASITPDLFKYFCQFLTAAITLDLFQHFCQFLTAYIIPDLNGHVVLNGFS